MTPLNSPSHSPSHSPIVSPLNSNTNLSILKNINACLYKYDNNNNKILIDINNDKPKSIPYNNF